MSTAYLGEELELGWRDEHIRGDALGEHHLGVLLPLDRRRIVPWVERVESALLQD